MPTCVHLCPLVTVLALQQQQTSTRFRNLATLPKQRFQLSLLFIYCLLLKTLGITQGLEMVNNLKELSNLQSLLKNNKNQLFNSNKNNKNVQPSKQNSVFNLFKFSPINYVNL